MDKRTPDEWARELELLPKPRRPGDTPICPLLEGAKVHFRWVPGDQLTREEFESGMQEFGALPLGGAAEEATS